MSKPVFSDLFRFAGRRNRKSYFLYGICYTIVAILLGVVAALSTVGPGGDDQITGAGIVIAILAACAFLALVISGWAVVAQRCRDFGWTGWAILITVIPFIGTIFALALLFIPGTLGPNRFGPDPIPNHVNDWPKA